MSKTQDFLSKWSDYKRHPLIVENPDWDEYISPALIDIGSTYEKGIFDLKSFFIVMRVLCEVIYCMGYEAGKTK